ERDLVAEPVAAAQVEHLDVDVPLDEAKDVRVRAALHLAHEAALLRRQERQLVDERQAVRQVLLSDVERAAANDVVIDVPADSLGSGDRASVTLGRRYRLGV